MKTLIKLFLLIVILHVFFAGCSDTSSDDTSEDELETAIVAADKKPLLHQLLQKLLQ